MEKIFYNKIPLGFNKKHMPTFDTQKYSCNVIISENCKEYLLNIIYNLTNKYENKIYIEIQGDDEQLRNIINDINLNEYNHVPMRSIGFLKYSLGILQFYSNKKYVLEYIVSLWDSELFLRLSHFVTNEADLSFDKSFAGNFIKTVNNSDVIITQSGDGDEIEIVFRKSFDFNSLIFNENSVR